MTAKAPALRSVVNPDDSRFLNPPDMPKAVHALTLHTPPGGLQPKIRPF